jgi:arginyl-tRNA synthetase
VITGDLGSALGLDVSGTWRPPPDPGAAPGTYATSLPFSVARSTGEEPRQVAAALATKLRAADWVADASATGGGYLTVTVTPEALAALAVRVPAAGTGCATSNALSGHSFPPPPVADLAAAADWDQAWDLVAAQVTARLAAAAGAQIVKAKKVTERKADVRAGPADAAQAAGAEAVRYALARTPFHRVRLISPTTYVRNTLANPFFAVRYAHARAASVLRWAGDLGIDRGEPGAFRPELLAQPGERELLGAISWLPERAASAARRKRPDAFARYLEWLAASWLSCAENCPALPFGGRSAPPDQAGMAARLWLAAAAATALETCLRLTGVAPPERL